MAVCAGGVAVLAGGVAGEPADELCPAELELPAGAAPPALLCATAQLPQHNTIDSNASFLDDMCLRPPGLSRNCSNTARRSQGLNLSVSNFSLARVTTTNMRRSPLRGVSGLCLRVRGGNRWDIARAELSRTAGSVCAGHRNIC